ncbi:MAG TPA: hypothetical protein VK422_08005 [Pyrinomonadaceae bacterium]|nr:hypothetical protein [Pyrinomonadaceae bacterium]
MNRLQAICYALFLVLALAFESDVSAGQKKKVEEMPQGTHVLWQEPADIESRDLLVGPGGEEMRPDLSDVTFLKDESTTGYSVKFRVRDGKGKTWVAKLGNEAQPETAAVRLTWAVGYATEVNYLAPCVRIKGAPKPKKDVNRCENNGFANVRFEARSEDVKRLDSWSWRSNHFSGSKEFAGLVVMMGLFNNWDLKDDNNKVIYVPGANGAQGELRHIVSDLGATFGKTGNFITHSRNEPEKFAKTKFVEKVEGGKVRFDLSTKNSALFDDITVENAAWIGGLLAKLSDKQIEDAFRAANYSPEEVSLLATALKDRIRQLNELAGPAPAEPTATPAPDPTPDATPAPDPTPDETPSPEPTATPTPTPTSPRK